MSPVADRECFERQNLGSALRCTSCHEPVRPYDYYTRSVPDSRALELDHPAYEVYCVGCGSPCVTGAPIRHRNCSTLAAPKPGSGNVSCSLCFSDIEHYGTYTRVTEVMVHADGGWSETYNVCHRHPAPCNNTERPEMAS